MKSLIILPLLLLLFIFHTQAQKMPQGKWQNDNMLDKTMEYKIEFQKNKVLLTRKMPSWKKEFAKTEAVVNEANVVDTTSLPVEKPMNEEPIEEEWEDRNIKISSRAKIDTTIITHYEIVKIINKKNDESKGIIYLKNTEKSKQPIMVIIFNQIEEEILLLQPMREFESLEIAEKEVVQAQKEIIEATKEMTEADKKMAGINPKTLKDIDIYTFGYMIMLRTEQSLAEINKMPALELKTKIEVLNFLSDFEQKLKDVKISENIQTPLISQWVVNNILIDMGYNPYNSLEHIDKIMRHYKEDEKIRKLNENIENTFAEKFGYK